VTWTRAEHDRLTANRPCPLTDTPTIARHTAAAPQPLASAPSKSPAERARESRRRIAARQKEHDQ